MKPGAWAKPEPERQQTTKTTEKAKRELKAVLRDYKRPSQTNGPGVNDDSRRRE
jgi:hypothetical protein